MTIPHYFDFGPDRPAVGEVLQSSESWDQLRGTRSVFGIPATYNELRQAAEDRPEFDGRARDVLRTLSQFGSRLASYGVGAGLLEVSMLLLHPELELTLTDFAPRTVESVRKLFPRSAVHQHDLRSDGPLPADLHLFHRVDSEFSDLEWRTILARWPVPILFVVTEILTPKRLARELVTRIAHPRATRTGFTRNAGSFRWIFTPTHTAAALSVGDLDAFLLTPRGR